MINHTVRAALNQLVEDLLATHGDNLASVVLYGSAAAGDFVALRSDYNILVALNSITPADLRLAHAPARDWLRLGNPLPVYFTVEELKSAADVFPIEFHQMEKARVVVYGRDPFESLSVTDQNLRHQTEYELRSKFLQLRRLYIPASLSSEKLADLMSESLASFAALFRAVLILFREEPPVSKLECVRATAAKLNLDREPFEQIFDLRTNEEFELSDREANDLFSAYMIQIERVIDAVDSLKNET